jgi:YihY family inner membrane protein
MMLFADGRDDGTIIRETLTQLEKVIPYLDPSFEKDLRMIIRNRSGLGVAGGFGLLLAASQVFRAVEFSLARIFARLDHTIPTDDKARPKNFLSSKLWFGLVVTSTVLAYLTVRLFAGVLRHLSDTLDLPPTLRHWLGDPLSGATPLGALATALFLVVGFAVLLKVFSAQEVQLRFAFIGGVCFMVSLQGAHRVYDFYLARLTNIGAVYGSFATLIVIVLWIYFSATLLLICCHVTKTVQRRVTVGPRWPKEVWV